MGKSSDTGGVKPIAIAGRLVDERERLLGMTDQERAFRKQWLKDQELSPNEPRVVPEIYRETHNPIRRFYRFPLDVVGKALTPVLGPLKAEVARYLIGKAGLGLVLVYASYYTYKYHGNEWDRKYGIRSYVSKPVVLPGDADFPYVSNKKPHEYGSRFLDESLKL